MKHTIPALFLAALLALGALTLGAGVSSADEAAKAKPDAKKAVVPKADSDEDVAEALEAYKVAFKAKGLRGDDRTAQRDYAMEQLSAYQHKKVIDALAKAMRHSDENVRLAAIVHMGSQTAHPAYAGKAVAKMMQRFRKDEYFMISAFETLGKIKYLGAKDYLEAGLKHHDFGVKKAAIAAIGETRDFRLLSAMLKEVGIDAERVAAAPEGGGQPEQVGESYEWEGAEAHVDTGTAGDGDQKAAEKQAKEQAAANEAKAKQQAKMGKTGGSLGGGVGQGGGRGGSSRSKQELIHPIKTALAKLTGEDFNDAKSIFAWLRANEKAMVQKAKEVTVAEKAQKAAEKKK